MIERSSLWHFEAYNVYRLEGTYITGGQCRQGGYTNFICLCDYDIMCWLPFHLRCVWLKINQFLAFFIPIKQKGLRTVAWRQHQYKARPLGPAHITWGLSATNISFLTNKIFGDYWKWMTCSWVNPIYSLQNTNSYLYSEY